MSHFLINTSKQPQEADRPSEARQRHYRSERWCGTLRLRLLRDSWSKAADLGPGPTLCRPAAELGRDQPSLNLSFPKTHLLCPMPLLRGAPG